MAAVNSSSVQATLIPTPIAVATRTPNQPLLSASPTAPPSEWPTATTGAAPVTCGAIAAAQRAERIAWQPRRPAVPWQVWREPAAGPAFGGDAAEPLPDVAGRAEAVQQQERGLAGAPSPGPDRVKRHGVVVGRVLILAHDPARRARVVSVSGSSSNRRSVLYPQGNNSRPCPQICSARQNCQA
jgi:hypothetical protein